MAQDTKYGKIDIPGIPDDEPVFVIRGKDKAAPDAIDSYAYDAEDHGASKEFVASVRDRAREVSQWQSENRDKVKVPD